MKDAFRKFAHEVSNLVGAPLTFLVACLAILLWACLGPIFDYSDTWQLIINTSTTIVTFLMVFLIQNTQSRDARAIQLKLDELIRASTHARNKLIDLETLSDKELDQLHKDFDLLKEEAEKKIKDIKEHKHIRGQGQRSKSLRS
ncbi:MAG: low affinity iron permease family protein [Pseudobdellovibrionaceae bacterium]